MCILSECLSADADMKSVNEKESIRAGITREKQKQLLKKRNPFLICLVPVGEVENAGEAEKRIQRRAVAREDFSASEAAFREGESPE